MTAGPPLAMSMQISSLFENSVDVLIGSGCRQPRLQTLDTSKPCFKCYIQKLLLLLADLTKRNAACHIRGVAVEATANIDQQQLTLADHLVSRPGQEVLGRVLTGL